MPHEQNQRQYKQTQWTVKILFSGAQENNGGDNKHTHNNNVKVEKRNSDITIITSWCNHFSPFILSSYLVNTLNCMHYKSKQMSR